LINTDFVTDFTAVSQEWRVSFDLKAVHDLLNDKVGTAAADMESS
jgi:hypothetical protein